MGCCGQKSGASVEFEAKANNGKVQQFKDNATARLFLANNGGGTVKAVPKTAPKA